MRVTPCRSTELRCKEVINIRDGCRLGCVCDVEVELPGGQVCAIWVPGPWRWLGFFGHDGYYRIPWSCIRRAGDDIILVEVDLPGCRVRREWRRPRR